MNSTKNILHLLIGIILLIFNFMPDTYAQTRAERAFREYTNPDEMVTFDRSTDFTRALDVINDFAQENRGKIILDRTGTTGSIGISIPAMHWLDALGLMLNVKGLALIENEDFFEIVKNVQPGGGQVKTDETQTTSSTGEVVVTTDTREVRINAIFFEGNRRALQEIGVDWSTLSENVPSEIIEFVGNEGREEFPTTVFDGPFVQVNSKGAQTVSQNVFNSIINFGELGTSGIEVQALFSAFEADNLGEILASPSIKVMEGQEGNIQVGQDFSIKQRDIAGNVLDEFVSVGTILTVTPRIINYNDTTFIHLDLAAERSSAQPDPVSTIINKQEASTQALLMDGEATVIAGLYRTEQSEVRRGIPILKDLPPWLFGLRYLFGYNSKDYQMSELVIIVQASIEPTVPERYDRNDYLSKFDLLKKERTRTKEEVLEYEKDSPLLPDPGEMNNPQAKMKMVEMEEDEEQSDSTEDPFASVDSSVTHSEEMVSNTNDLNETLINDPEVKTKPIPLNFAEEKSAENNVNTGTGDSVRARSALSDTTGTMESEELSSDQPINSGTTDEEERLTGDQNPSYFIIGGSFRSKGNAEKLRKQLVAEGFNSIILTKPDSAMYMVTYKSFDDPEKARVAITDIRQYKNKNAWLYKVR